MALNKKIAFTKSHTVVKCAPTLMHCSKGQLSSASISIMDVCAINDGLMTTVEVWDQRESKMYVFDARTVIKHLYRCGSSDFMAFCYKTIPALEVR